MSEREFEGHEALVAQLRAGTLDAPGHVHRRVLDGGQSKRRRFADMSGRRRAFVLVPVAATLAVGAAVVHGAFFAGSSTVHASAPPLNAGKAGSTHTLAHTSKSVHGGGGVTGPTGPNGGNGATGLTGLMGKPAPNSRSFDSLQASAAGTFNSPARYGLESPLATIPKNRHVHADATLQVAVANPGALTRATNKASQIVTHLGGYTKNSHIQASRNGDGAAYLELRVPVGKAEVAIQELGALGRVVSQAVSTQDLQQRFTKQTDTIGRIRRAIAVYEQALHSGTLSGSQQVDVQIQLTNAQYELTSALKSRSHTAAYAATADIQLTLATNKHAFAVVPHKRGRLGRLLHNAGAFLALEGVIVLYVLIVAGPIVLLLALAWWLARQRRQRGERRLLASA